jgi:hypothetical protein
MALIALSFVSLSLPRAQKERIYAHMLQRIESERDPLDLAEPCSSTGASGFRRKVGRRNLVHQGAEANGSLPAKGGRKLSLRIFPPLDRAPQAIEAGVRQSQLLAATVRAAWLDADQSIAFERQDVSPKGGAVHHHVLGQRIDRYGPLSPQSGEDGELGRAQPHRGQMPIIKLRDMPRRLTNGEAGALLEGRQGVGWHFESGP